MLSTHTHAHTHAYTHLYYLARLMHPVAPGLIVVLTLQTLSNEGGFLTMDRFHKGGRQTEGVTRSDG